MRVWVDLANSPHPVLFEPIVDELESAGHEVLITARDHAQTVAIAAIRWPAVQVIGGSSPPGRAGKLRAVAGRANELARFARRHRPDVAVSHNSYAQSVAARTVGIPCVTAMDYEHQPANHIAFRAANRVLVPGDFPAHELRLAGARRSKVWRYCGFKEEVYLYRFTPDTAVLAELGLEEGEPFFVARPSPEGAAYHQFGNPLFDEVLDRLLERERVKLVLLPRQREDTSPPLKRAGTVIVPSAPVDTRSLLYFARALIGAGGTMNREAALLGTPVFGLYAGRMAALDQRLIEEGKVHPLDQDLDGFEAKLTALFSRERARVKPLLTAHVLDRFVEAITTPLTAGTRGN